MRIGKLAELTNVSRDALRLYEARGLIQSQRFDNGYRDYSENTVALVKMIKLAQKIGFTLAEMEPEMAAIAKYGMGAEQVATLLAAKLSDVDDRINDLVDQRHILAKMVESACPIQARIPKLVLQKH